MAVFAWAGALGLLFGFLDLKETTRDLPFESPLLGGIALAVVVALPMTLTAVATVTRRRWSDLGHLVAGSALMGWIVVQVAIIGLNSWLQPVMFAWGAVILGLGVVHRRSRPHGVPLLPGEAAATRPLSTESQEVPS